MPTKTTKPATAETPPDDTPSIEEYERRREELIAKLPKEADRPLHLIDKLALVTGLVGRIEKRGENTFHHYRYATEADLVEAIRPLLAELGIRIHQSLYGDPEAGFVPHQRLAQVKRDKKSGAVTESDSLTAISMVFWFEHVGPDGTVEKTEPQVFMGYGDDNSDKGIYKAFTGCEKYFLMKTFLVSTGDDPEGDSRADKRAEERMTVRQAPRTARNQPAQGGRQQEVSDPQAKVLGQLLRARGYTSGTAVLEYLRTATGLELPLIDNDAAATLQKALTEDIKPDVMGQVIADLRREMQQEGDADEAVPAEVSESEDGADTEDDAGPAY